MQCVEVAESKQGFTDTTPMDLPLSVYLAPCLRYGAVRNLTWT